MRRNAADRQNHRLAWAFSKLAFLMFCFIVLAFLAPFWWGFELFSHFSWHYMIATAALTFVFLVLKRPFLIIVCLVLTALSCWQVSSYIIKPQQVALVDDFSDTDISLLQFNLATDNKRKENVIKWIGSELKHTDIIILQEVTPEWNVALETIKNQYFYSFSTNPTNNHNILVLSQLLVNSAKNINYIETELLELDMATSEGVPFNLYAIHSPSPLNKKGAEIQKTMLNNIASNISQRNKAAIVVGDFATTPFSPVFKDMVKRAKLYNSWLKVGYHGSWPAPFPSELALSIDHLLVNDEVYIHDKMVFKDSHGSDHYPLLTKKRFKNP